MTNEQLISLIGAIRRGYSERIPEQVDARLESAIEAIEDGSLIDATIELRGAMYDYAGGDDVMLDLANAYVAAFTAEALDA